jgi:hypothetical protein
MLLNKQEVLESFDDFTEYYRRRDDREDYSEYKRKIPISLCEEFRKELEKSDIPTLTKPWLYYDYSITNDSIELYLFECEEISFDEEDEGIISSMTFSEESTLTKVTCDYLTVEQYASAHGVAATAVRQWLRCGKLRTAKKKGRCWLIPALADKPKRGFKSVTYYRNALDDAIVDAFPFLAGAYSIYIFQDKEDKKVFWAVLEQIGTDERIKIELTAKEREQLELMLIVAPEVIVGSLRKPPKKAEVS